MFSRHVFHTRHDFTPEFAWAAFQLLSGVGSSEISSEEFQTLAEITASPLVKRSDLNKLFAAMDEIGITRRSRNYISLTTLGETLARGIGRYEAGFAVAIHCLYVWTWLWQRRGTATPSWSYREVCRQLLASGATGINGDELVLRVVSRAAEVFNPDKISFSKSSVAGVTMWLETQSPALAQRFGSRIFVHNTTAPIADALRLHLAALCAYRTAETSLDSESVELLAESLLIATDVLLGHVFDFAQTSKEFLLIPSSPYRIVFKESQDPFINWIITSACPVA